MLDGQAFAGSVATTDRLVRVMRDVAGVQIEDAVRMITATPARIMGLTEKGRVAPSYDADLTVFDDAINMSRVYRGGKCLFEAK